MKFWIKLSVSIVAFAIALFLGFLRYCTWKSQSEAESFILEMRSLEIGKSTAADLKKLIESTSWLANGEFHCSASRDGNCMGRVTFRNVLLFRWPYALRFTRPMGFRCWLYTVSGVLQNSTCYMTPVGFGEMYAFVEDGDREPPGCGSALKPENRYFKIKEIPTGFLGVCINPQTPPELRDLANKFDFSCFSRLRGCSTYEEMLPVLSRKDLY